MTATAILIGLVIVGFTTYMAVLPVLTARRTATKAARENAEAGYSVQELRARLELLLDSIRDLDFDYDTGKVSNDVYAEQRKMLIGRSVSVLMQLDTAEAHLSSVDDEIEIAITSFREREHESGNGAVDRSIEASIASHREKVAR